MNRSELVAVAMGAIRGCGVDSMLYPSIGLFVRHHLTELPPAYWRERLGQDTPEPQSVLSLLVAMDADDSGDADDESEARPIDFSLPGSITNYVLAVYIDDSGNIDDIAMES